MNNKTYKNLFYLTIILCILIFKAGEPGKYRQRKRQQKQSNYKKVDKSSQLDSSKNIVKDTIKTEKEEEVSYFMPISDWPGKTFILLEKTKIFQKFGYELYTSPLFSKGTSSINPDIELKNHRLKYDFFCLRNVLVVSVKKIDRDEYQVTFKTDTLGLTVYGKTKDRTIEGLALYEDYKKAQKYFLGKTIFSRHRYINVFDSTSSSFTSKKVLITQPLKVFSITWGVVPLPPKSIWLHVKSSDGIKGIIPINISWTNVLNGEKEVGFSWKNDIFETSPKQLYNWDDFVWRTINKHNIFIGMTSKQVRFSWGVPKKIKIKKEEKNQKILIYTYDSKILKFENDLLVNTYDIDN